MKTRFLLPTLGRGPAVLCLFLLTLSLGACTAATESPRPMQPVVQPMSYQEPPANYPNPGSIFNEYDANYLYADSRARRVGDILMINIVETATGTNSATTDTNRDSTSEYGVDVFFGKTALPIIPGQVGGPILATNTKKEFSADGQTTRKNNISATVAARVLRVLPDGLMQLEGVRETRVNNETQYLVVTGLARARDVAPDNSIMSTQLADAQISYYGQGVISDKQKPGWFTRFLDNVWPF